jgi:hypothetical protein
MRLSMSRNCKLTLTQLTLFFIPDVDSDPPPESKKWQCCRMRLKMIELFKPTVLLNPLTTTSI